MVEKSCSEGQGPGNKGSAQQLRFQGDRRSESKTADADTTDAGNDCRKKHCDYGKSAEQNAALVQQNVNCVQNAAELTVFAAAGMRGVAHEQKRAADAAKHADHQQSRQQKSQRTSSFSHPNASFPDCVRFQIFILSRFFQNVKPRNNIIQKTLQQVKNAAFARLKKIQIKMNFFERMYCKK